MTKAMELRQREGSVLAIVAVMLVALLAVVALAVDLGMAYTARAEAQRMADAAALAGASAYLDHLNPTDAVADVRQRAYDYVARNTVRNQNVDSAQDVNVEVVPSMQRVRVWVQRRDLGTWFARFLGIDRMTVNAAATAQALTAGGAKCLKPWALMDLWNETTSDTDQDRWWDEGESWEYDATSGDTYQRTSAIGENAAGNPNAATGYGSAFRNEHTNYKNDWGRRIHIKAPDPNAEYVPNPGTFLPWRVGPDDSGGADYRWNIANCNLTTIFLGDGDPSTTEDQYPIETGNMVGPTFQGVRDLIAQDPTAQWNETVKTDGTITGEITGSQFPGLESPRVIKVAMIDPYQLVTSGMQTVEFTNFALLFLEDMPAMHDDVTARFLYYVDGSAVGSTTSPLVKIIRLVE